MDTQKLYGHLLNNPPRDAAGNRNRGSTAHDEFWRGYDGQLCMSAKTSFGHSAWRAGRDYRTWGRYNAKNEDAG